MYSKLIKSTIESPCFSERNGQKVTKITIHHAAGCLSAEALASIFKVQRRSASCNYAIGIEGDIIGVVPEEKRSWCSGSRWNDEQAITIEVSNCKGKPGWEVSETVMQSLVLLCADICRRYCIVPYFNGTKDASMTFHYMFQATECPGPYIKNNVKTIITRINNELCVEQKPVPAPEKPMNENQDFFKVKVTCNDLNIRSGPGTKYKIVGHIKDKGVYTIVDLTLDGGTLTSLFLGLGILGAGGIFRRIWFLTDDFKLVGSHLLGDVLSRIFGVAAPREVGHQYLRAF